MKCHQVKNLIIKWLKNYTENHSISKFIVGVSGGIDSALTSTLCAMTGIKTIVIFLPINQTKNETDNAKSHMKWLKESYHNIQTETIELSDLFNEFKIVIPVKFQNKLSLANSRARLRMTTLYQIAAKENGIVVGTGNKIEDFGIGFFTKYGDGGVDISPIADLKKSEVKELAKFCKIDTKIINAKPTDGLWEDGRTDEDQIGATYSELEWAMSYNGNQKLTSQQKRVLKIYSQLNKQNQHKMSTPPVCEIPTQIKN